MNSDEIPFFPPDLFEGDRKVLLNLVREIGTSRDQRFILGDRTRAFEEQLRAQLGAADVVACGSGTTALTLVLRAMGIGAGDEVVVPAFGCAPLASSVVSVGAEPVFADIDPDTMVLDPDRAEEGISPRTRAVMPAHMFSVMADMPRFAELADRAGLRLVEDSAVAQGAVLRGVPAGLWGEAGVFSFVQVKSFGMPGEGGAVVTRDDEIARVVRMLRNHGQDGRQRFVHHLVGYNSRFDEIQAAFQSYRLAGFAARLERRARIAEYYTERFAPLADSGVVPPPPGREGRCYYVYSVQAERRDELREHLASLGIASHVYYPAPLPMQPAFSRYTAEGQRWPNAERASRRILALPVYPHLTDAQVERIADAVCEFAGERSEAHAWFTASGPAPAGELVSDREPGHRAGSAWDDEDGNGAEPHQEQDFTTDPAVAEDSGGDRTRADQKEPSSK
ncbi:dTDP-4-amino-4,6-dideoxygalactose transaminase [Saccharopolyspora erythraea NRRL 2338]|uniref:DegT/DnrJ/EryC1/StrS aminotransferase n=2 Tax=Saccharopolyspora erythraea TaxID=1836 RepID=A4FEL3_SACEN|nr:DegT/DnrJ/EryC1/StrS family aminotransferase [Saccharopolyspora erythraea]PFG96213.1 dTDP-4-amino-4,6-dideoxygalactose transaminase [Saccharopolyspora erythraea NRRL 2338]QRK92741.1 DegT/DnrJ/EryC1/StrS family aminotransferase [Saccharopolyspora erythraea]CAM02488.1 DegT/DnrJ/EryC1/StrS aminotransferase [Saccharopolyspora erythraea NRRL 2338]